MTGPRRVQIGDRPTAPQRALRESVWIATQFALVAMLAATGFAMHFPGPAARFIPLSRATATHEILACLLLANSALGLLVLGATGRLGRALPKLQAPVRDSFGEAAWLILAWVLLPLQAATGLVMALGNRRPGILTGFFGLPVLGPAHTFGAYLSLAFVILALFFRPRRSA